MKIKEKVLKEIKKIQLMLLEEEGSLWVSENETYMQEKRDRLKELKSNLKSIEKTLAEVGKVIDDFKLKVDIIGKEDGVFLTPIQTHKFIDKELKKELGI